MAWGVFKKIATGVKKGYDFVKNDVLPVAKKVIEYAKPMFAGTKWEKYVDKAENITDEADKRLKSAHPPPSRKQSSGMSDRYKRAQNIQPEFTIDDDEDDYE